MLRNKVQIRTSDWERPLIPEWSRPAKLLETKTEGTAILDTKIITDLDDARPYLDAWDRLAVDSSKPYCSPAWITAWWTHAAPKDSTLRLMLAFEGGDLVGVAPFFADRSRFLTRFRLLGARCSSRLDLLARSGMEPVVGSALASSLASMDPAPDVVMFEGISADSPWPALLTGEWPRRSASLIRQFHQPAPSIHFEGRTYEEWFASKSGHFRQGMRRSLRQLQREGGSIRMARSPDELEQGLRTFSDLHHRRWRSRGGSGVLNEGVERMLLAAGKQLVDEARMRIWTVDLNGKPISSHLFLTAGEETAYWLGGFDEGWAHLQPAVITILTAIEHAFSVGDRKMDLGTGAQEYKLRFADGADDIHWILVVPAGPRSGLARTQLLGERVRMAVADNLSPEVKRRIRRARRRLAGPRGTGRPGD